jgi:hypothetical protein
MNTPKTRKPTRWTDSQKPLSRSDKGYFFGIRSEPIAELYGLVISYWWYVEDAMIRVFEDLLDGKRNDTYSHNSTARKMFRTIVSQDARIKLMRGLLEGMPHNEKMSALYDDLLDRFQALNRTRNQLVHGAWTTDGDAEIVSLRRSSDIPFEYETPEVITEEYLVDIFEKMQALNMDATLRGGPPISSR